ncbi:MAG: type IV pilus biogenesis/stability protein PilW [Thiohalobacterales bacterium]|nr:type IV pilus biogenesis/stability protein PilW [Thiohalobacterales bacterium]
MFPRRIAFFLVTAWLLGGCAGAPSTPDKSRTLDAAKANTQLGIEYMRAGEFEKSRDRLEKALSLAPDYPGAHNAIAVLYEQVGETASAEKHYRKSLRLDPENATSHNNYGQFLCKSGRFDDAVKEFMVAAEKPFYSTPWVPYTNAGICMLSVPDRARAEEYFRTALQANTEYAPALLQMAQLSFDDGKYLGTRAYLQRYQEVARHTAETLWLGVRAEYALDDHEAWGSYALMLKVDFPDSEQTLLLQEWENERRAGK